MNQINYIGKRRGKDEEACVIGRDFEKMCGSKAELFEF